MLTNTEAQQIKLNPAEIERLSSLSDYSTMSQSVEDADEWPANVAAEPAYPPMFARF
jgi:hypothetical protein